MVTFGVPAGVYSVDDYLLCKRFHIHLKLFENLSDSTEHSATVIYFFIIGQFFD